MNNVAKKFAPAVAILLILVCNDTAIACPTCKNALHSGLALGYAVSVLFMMAMPFVIFAWWVVTVVRLRSKMVELDPETFLKQQADRVDGLSATQPES
jgi:hypothetical protein